MQPKLEKSIKKPLILEVQSLLVINVDTTEKLVTSPCCDRQHAHAYLQPFLCVKAATAFSAS